MTFNKNDAANLLGLSSGTMRTVMALERLTRITGNQPTQLNMYTVVSLCNYIEELWQLTQVAGGDTPRVSPVWRLWLFLRKDDAVILKAIFLQFVRYSQLRDTSVHLCYFMPGSGKMAIITFEDMRVACMGLQLFFELVYGWANVMYYFVSQIDLGAFENFSVQYVLSELYTALTCLTTVALDTARTKPFRPQPTEFYLELLMHEIAQVRTRCTWENSQLFKPNQVDYGPPDSASDTRVASSSDTPRSATKPAALSPQPSRDVSKEVCMKDLRAHYKMIHPNGQPFPICELPCKRLHYGAIPQGRNKEDTATIAERSSFPAAAGKELAKFIRADPKFA